MRIILDRQRGTVLINLCMQKFTFQSYDFFLVVFIPRVSRFQAIIFISFVYLCRPICIRANSETRNHEQRKNYTETNSICEWNESKMNEKYWRFFLWRSSLSCRWTRTNRWANAMHWWCYLLLLRSLKTATAATFRFRFKIYARLPRSFLRLKSRRWMLLAVVECIDLWKARGKRFRFFFFCVVFASPTTREHLWSSKSRLQFAYVSPSSTSQLLVGVLK